MLASVSSAARTPPGGQTGVACWLFLVKVSSAMHSGMVLSSTWRLRRFIVVYKSIFACPTYHLKRFFGDREALIVCFEFFSGLWVLINNRRTRLKMISQTRRSSFGCWSRESMNEAILGVFNLACTVTHEKVISILSSQIVSTWPDIRDKISLTIPIFAQKRSPDFEEDNPFVQCIRIAKECRRYFRGKKNYLNWALKSAKYIQNDFNVFNVIEYCDSTISREIQDYRFAAKGEVTQRGYLCICQRLNS